MSKLLINENPLILLPSLAIAFGVPEAIFLQQLHYWLQTSKTKHDGKKWCYNTVDEWHEQMSFFSKSTLERVLRSLKLLGVIQTDKLAANKSNRVNYYTINYEMMDKLAAELIQNNTVKLTESSRQIDGINSNGDTVKLTASNQQNDGMDTSKMTASIPSNCGDGYTETTRDSTETTSESAPTISKPQGRARKKPLTDIPSDFAISERVKAWAEPKGHTPHLKAHFDFFILKCQAKGYQYSDWDSAFMGAITSDWAGVKKQAPAGQAQQDQSTRQTETPPLRPTMVITGNDLAKIRECQKLVSPKFTKEFVEQNLIAGYDFCTTLAAFYMKAKANPQQFCKDHGLEEVA